MRLLVIRHAIAEPRDEWAETGEPDAHRPVSARGERRMRAGAAGLRSIVRRIDRLATSPLVRAAQTAEMVAERYGVEPETRPELAPEVSPDALLPWLRSLDPDATAAVVGHEPQLGFLVGLLLTGRHAAPVELKKGAACMLAFDDPPEPGGALLLWALVPRHLRALGES